MYSQVYPTFPGCGQSRPRWSGPGPHRSQKTGGRSGISGCCFCRMRPSPRHRSAWRVPTARRAVWLPYVENPSPGRIAEPHSRRLSLPQRRQCQDSDCCGIRTPSLPVRRAWRGLASHRDPGFAARPASGWTVGPFRSTVRRRTLSRPTGPSRCPTPARCTLGQ